MSRGAHGHGERLTGHADLERLLHRDLVVAGVVMDLHKRARHDWRQTGAVGEARATERYQVDPLCPREQLTGARDLLPRAVVRERPVDRRLAAPQLGHPDHIVLARRAVDHVELAAPRVREAGCDLEHQLGQIITTTRFCDQLYVSPDARHLRRTLDDRARSRSGQRRLGPELSVVRERLALELAVVAGPVGAGTRERR